MSGVNDPKIYAFEYYAIHIVQHNVNNTTDIPGVYFILHIFITYSV